MPTTTRYRVSGMTCAHCVSAVTAELGTVPGVTTVDIDLVAGGESGVVVTSDRDLDAEQLRAAIDEAGYDLVGHES